MSGFNGQRVSASSEHHQQQPEHYSADASTNGGDRDDDDLGSGSEHGGEHSYGNSGLGESDVPDVHHALTNQTLNSDGTPKRPMNAFMIFARRRRPQVSAANQMMRTGEISKILSKEWNSMPMSEKQFYLDQAKKLKDNFNSKYPDYVYRRRPNNSRRKRRAEPGMGRPYDGSGAGEQHDDGAASTEFDENSPVDTPGGAHNGTVSLQDSTLLGHPPPHSSLPHLAQPSLYPRHFPHPESDHDVSPTYEHGPASASSHSSSSSYHYSQGFADDFGTYHHPHANSSARLPHTHSLWPPSHDGGTSPGGKPSSKHSKHYSSHSDAGQHSPDDTPAHTLWGNSSVSNRIETPSSRASIGGTWPMPPPGALGGPGGNTANRQRSLTTIPPPLTTPTSKNELFSPNIPHRAWSNTPSSGSSASATSLTNTTGPSMFQTLTSPFFPNGGSAAGAGSGGGSASATPSAEQRSTSTSPHLPRDPYFTSGSARETGSGAYESSTPYPISPISPPHGSYFPHSGSTNGNGSSSHLYSSSSQRGHLLQPITTFSHGREMPSPLSAGPPSSSQGGYWDRVSDAR